MSTATSSARRSACSRSAARGFRAPGRRPAARSIFRASSPSPRRARWTAWRAATRRLPASAPIATGSPRTGGAAEAERCVGMMARSPLGARVELKGPVGERNVYTLRRRGRIAAVATSESGLLIQIGAILATGNDAVVSAALAGRALSGLPAELAHRISRVEDPLERACPRLRAPRRRPRRRRQRLCASSRSRRARSCGSRRCPAPASPPARTTISPTSSRNARPPPTPPRPAATPA